MNEHVFVVLTVQVNALLGGAVAGFVFSGDLSSSASCGSSDEGEIFYSHVPDAASGRTRASVLGQMPSLIAHEFAHTIQFSRLLQAGGTFMASWEAEGQATFAEEIVGHAILGNTNGANLDGAVVTQAGAGQDWYQFIFTRLARYWV